MISISLSAFSSTDATKLEKITTGFQGCQPCPDFRVLISGGESAADFGKRKGPSRSAPQRLLRKTSLEKHAQTQFSVSRGVRLTVDDAEACRAIESHARVAQLHLV